MRSNRPWIEIIGIGAGVACALALLFAILGVAMAFAAQAEQGNDFTAKTYEGVVTCSRCGAKHSAALGRTAADCTLVCVRGGATFALVDGDKTYQLDGDVNLLKKVVGRRTAVVGIARGNTILVSSLAATS